MITIYTTPTCASCKMVKKYFDITKVPYDVVDLSEDVLLQQNLIEKTGSLAVPITTNGNRYIVGYKPSELKELL